MSTFIQWRTSTGRTIELLDQANDALIAAGTHADGFGSYATVVAIADLQEKTLALRNQLESELRRLS